jgi:hypothetical protein
MALLLILSQSGLTENGAIVAEVVIVVAWLGGLIVAGIHGSKAKKLKKLAGIKWPGGDS